MKGTVMNGSCQLTISKAVVSTSAKDVTGGTYPTRQFSGKLNSVTYVATTKARP